MYRTASSNRVIGLAITSAMAGALLAGCTTAPGTRAEVSSSQSQAALAKGQPERAITLAEAAVLAEPHSSAYRAELGSAYLQAGRFASAVTAFEDAMSLGETSPRTALSLAVALMGQGRMDEAGSLLTQWEDRIPAADLGLALALAGKADRGVYVLGNAIRSGQNDVKVRQNLAYAYALAGRWREAQLMAAQDLAGKQLDDRIELWARMAHPDASQARVAGLLGVPTSVADPGQPVQLALANTPSVAQLAAEASPPVPVPIAEELPPLASVAAPAVTVPAIKSAPPEPLVLQAPALAEPSAPTSFQSAFAAPAVAGSAVAAPAPETPRAKAAPAVLPSQLRQASAAEPRAKAAAPRDGTHLIQLGSFASEAGARRAWGIYTKKYPQLAEHEMVISEAVVRGKRYWRVSAAGFGKASSSAMCGKVKASGAGCFAYAEGRPLPGAVDTGIRLARR